MQAAATVVFAGSTNHDNSSCGHIGNESFAPNASPSTDATGMP